MPTFSIGSLKTKGLGCSLRPYCERQVSLIIGLILSLRLAQTQLATVFVGRVFTTVGNGRQVQLDARFTF